MISVFVTFTYKDDFNESKLRQIAESAKPRFEGMPGLRTKVLRCAPSTPKQPMYTFGIPRSRREPSSPSRCSSASRACTAFDRQSNTLSSRLWLRALGLREGSRRPPPTLRAPLERNPLGSGQPSRSPRELPARSPGERGPAPSR